MRTAALSTLCGCAVCHSFVEGEEPPMLKQHEGNDEGPEVPLAAVAERVARSAGRLPRLEPSISRAWLPVSASEWPDSASNPADPVITKPVNLATAIPKLAKKAAMIAFRRPLAWCKVALPPPISKRRPQERGGNLLDVSPLAAESTRTDASLIITSPTRPSASC